ncbi:MAG: type I restriction endonuclease subunit R [Clostridiales bacterium]|nr:type I restriction endonuclease subunit R [Clostridiales bacterium]
MACYQILTQSSESTVVAEYIPEKRNAEAYQSEADLEREFIALLKLQGYEYLPIHTETDLIANLRVRIEELNGIKFTDSEWDRFFTVHIANANEGIAEKTRKLQDGDSRISFRRDDGLTKNIALIEKYNIHANKLQVINQYENNAGTYKNRYDVTILVNGLPLVHIELKRRGVHIREAFNQIKRYDRESFWAGSKLFQYVQIFVISNGTNTKYYSNTTRDNHINDAKRAQYAKTQRTSNSFEFTSFWADESNKIIPDLIDFTKTFFSKHTVLNILTKYCVFSSENMLLVMRPYQIAATEKILNKIEISHNYKQYGTLDGGGYIWHTTGSGKTLTSFKTAQLATALPYIEKVLFVVDRKDLDYQTMKEYDRFEKGAANSNTSTAILKKQLEDTNTRIIITTIQKLDKFIKKYKGHPIFEQHIVIIFDECHRSQFGDMHVAITKTFKKYHLFGFTGTPIFAVNARAETKHANLKTTEQAFGAKLHTYTIMNAINDKNVLPFRIEYYKSMDKEPNIDDKQVADIDREKAYNSPERIRKIVDYILTKFNDKTYRNEKSYYFNALTNISAVASASSKKAVEEIKNKLRLSGFNSIFCVSSIEAAKLYYTEFKRQMDENPSRKLKIATIFSYGANEEEPDGLLGEENSEDTSDLDLSSREFLESAIHDYNSMFKTNYDTSSDKFQNYYKDISLRMKNREIDLLIVVNMFLTGFDATTLNTLWVDKNLKQHGLLQAFSRTNRILNSIKTFGNIVCFRNLLKRTDDAIALFGDKDAGGICVLKSYNDYYFGYEDKQGYVDLIDELTRKYPLSEPQIIGEKAQKDFIALFGAILRMRNILSSFDDFVGNEILSERDMQDYQGRYNDLYDEWRARREEYTKENITDDIVFEIELIKQVEINIDYILLLVKKYHDGHCEDKEILISINKAIDSSLELRSKKTLIENFIAGINDVDDILLEWKEFVAQKKEEELATIIAEENLKDVETRKFVDHSFRDGVMKTTGTDLDSIMPPMSRFSGEREKKKANITNRLLQFFERFYGIG